MRFYRVGRQDLNCHKRGAYYKIEEDCELNNRVIIDKVIVGAFRLKVVRFS